MNHIYRLIWNDTLGAFVAVAENARARGKRNGLKLVSAAVLSALAFGVHALPTGGQISVGAGSIGQFGATMTVNQNTQNLAINWQSFGIAANEAVNFNQPNASAIALNRVLGSDTSQILGQLNANGQVWVLNPNGVLFGRTAQVNTGGLVASTLNISDADFLAGRRSFSGNGGSVINQGTLNADGGYVALLGGQVSNEGVITAQLGTVALAAGDKVTLDFNGDQLLNVQVEQGALDALAQNSQLIRADGGTVLMTAQAADALATAVVNNTGVIEARSIENHNGVIKLLGDMDHGTVNVGGTLDASSTGSGQASAPSPSASLLPLPLAGEGQGRGGFIETSAAHVKIADGTVVTTLAANGLTGSWLIDPVDFTIAASGGDMTGAVLTQSLNGTNVTILSTDGAAGTAGDVNVNDTVTWSANTLTLNAQNNININSAMMGSGTAGLALEYGQGAAAAGNSATYTVNAPVNLASTGSFSTKLGSDGAVKNYTIITTLGAFNSSTATDLQGMTGNKAGNYVLGANIDASPTSGWYDNGSGGFYGFVPVGAAGNEFTGSFDGLGHTVSNLYINRPATSFVGLFGATNPGATLRNVGLLNANVTGLSRVGALLGAVNGTTVIDNSYATGTVSGVGLAGVVGGLAGGVTTINDSHAAVTVSGGGAIAGGLVGQANAINRSYATGSVNGTGQVGGLAGYGRDVTDSYATGAVSGTGNYVGGLAGLQTVGTISNSYATGSVGGASYVGGLVGYGNQSGGSIATSYASGAVTGGTGVGGLAGSYLGTISNSYATGSANGIINVGGLVGELDGGAGAASITNSYATGLVFASTANGGGLLGLLSNGATVTTSYWDTVTTTQATSAGGAGAVGKTTAQLAAALPTGFSSATWGNAGNQTTPYLLGHSGFDTAGPTYLGSDGAVSPTAYGVILNVNQLQAMGNNLAGNYVLGINIDASATSGWNGGAGFVPVGNSGTKFTGSFDGLGHTVTGLTINRPDWLNPAHSYQGLFGYAGVGSTLRNVGLLNSSIAGANAVGALAGRSDGAISNSYADGGSVTTSVHNGGGLVGVLGDGVAGHGSIGNSYANVSVSGANGGGASSSSIGGLVGRTDLGSSIGNSYATGSVSGGSYVGGLVGQNKADIDTSYASGAVTATNSRGGFIGDQQGGAITNSYWDAATTGVATSNRSGNIAGVTDVAAAPNAQASYTGFDFAGSWRIYEGQTRPLLKSFLTPLTVTATSGSKIYDGSTNGLGVTYSITPNANLLGTAVTTSTSSNVGVWTVAASGLYSNQRGYDIAFVDGAIIIDPVPLILLGITAADVAKTYGTAYTFTGTEFIPVGLQGGETIGSVTLTSTGAPASAPVGSYAIAPSNATGGTFNPANYDITYVNGTLTVNPAPLAVTANNAIKTYDGLAWSGNNGVSYSGFVNGETSAVLGGALVYGGTSQGAVGAGSYAITPSGLTSGNYTIAFNDGVLTVNPAPLTVTANDVSRFYDGRAYTGGNGVVYGGFVNGETSAVLGGALVYGGSSQGAVDAGNYAITPSGLTSGNYTIVFNDGTLSINQRIPTIPGAPVDSYAGATDREAGTASGTTEDVSAVAPADAAGGKVGSVKLSSDAAAGASANQYVLVTQGCGLRLPDGLDCR